MLSVLGVLFDGLAYGSLLFLISIGLSATMGLMNFINLTHGAFAMADGYVRMVLMNRLDVPFLAMLPIVFVVTVIIGFVFECTLYRRLYHASPLDQVPFSIVLIFVAMASVTYVRGPSQQPVELPEMLRGQWPVFDSGLEVGRYRLSLIGVVIALTALLTWLIERTRFGAQARASVDNRQTSTGLGINVNLVFSVTFALGSGLAGLGGGLDIDMLGLDPAFPIKYMVYFLLVVTVGGAGSIKGTSLAAPVLGVSDVAGKYYVPDAGAFVIYGLMAMLLVFFPGGLLGRHA